MTVAAPRAAARVGLRRPVLVFGGFGAPAVVVITDHAGSTVRVPSYLRNGLDL